MIPVIGFHRSGTSMVAHMLKEMGCFMGERFREPDETQPHGYWEDLDWRDINSALLQRAHGSWYCPPHPLLLDAHFGEFIPQIEALIDSRESMGAAWGFKDPRTCLTWHYLVEKLPNPRAIIVTRNRAAVMDSLERRAASKGYHEPREHWEALYNIYEESIWGIHLNAPILEVYFWEILENPLKVAKDIARFAGLSNPEAGAAVVKR